LRFLRLIGLLIFVCSLLTGSAVYGTRLGVGYNCLTDFNHRYVVDVTTKQGQYDKRPHLAPRELLGDSYSPDGTRWAGLNGNMSYSMDIENLITGKSVGLQGDVVSSFSMDFGTAWSSDGSRLAYFWKNNSAQYFLATVTADGDDKHEVALINQTDPKRPETSGLQGWSPDGQYIAVGVGGDIQFFSSTTLKEVVVSPQQIGSWIDGARGVSRTIWAKQGHTAAFGWFDNQQKAYLTIVSPDGTVNRTFNTLLNGFESGIDNIFWLPGDQYVVVTTLAGDQFNTDVFGIDGTAFHNVTHVNPDVRRMDDIFPGPSFSLDGRLISFVEWPNGIDQPELLKVFDIRNGRYETLADDVIGSPVYSLQTDRLAVAWQHNKRIAVDVMDLAGLHRATLLSEVGEVETMVWSPDDQWLAIAWKSRTDDVAPIQITWVNPKSGEQHNVSTSSWQVYTLQWSRDSQAFAYITGDGERANLEVLNLSMGRPLRLLDRVAAISAISVDPTTGWLTFWWRNTKGKIAASFYIPGHATMFSSPVQNPVTDQLVWDPSGALVNASALFPSPDGASLAIFFHRVDGDLFTNRLPSNPSLQLAHDKLQAQNIAPNAELLSPPVWSPDGKKLVFIHSVSANQQFLDIWSSEGQPLWQTNQDISLGDMI